MGRRQNAHGAYPNVRKETYAIFVQSAGVFDGSIRLSTVVRQCGWRGRTVVLGQRFPNVPALGREVTSRDTVIQLPEEPRPPQPCSRTLINTKIHVDLFKVCSSEMQRRVCEAISWLHSLSFHHIAGLLISYRASLPRSNHSSKPPQARHIRCSGQAILPPFLRLNCASNQDAVMALDIRPC